MLIAGALEVGRDAPMMNQPLALIDSEYRLMVADVDGDEHEVSGALSMSEPAHRTEGGCAPKPPKPRYRAAAGSSRAPSPRPIDSRSGPRLIGAGTIRIARYVPGRREETTNGRAQHRNIEPDRQAASDIGTDSGWRSRRATHRSLGGRSSMSPLRARSPRYRPLSHSAATEPDRIVAEFRGPGWRRGIRNGAGIGKSARDRYFPRQPGSDREYLHQHREESICMPANIHGILVSQAIIPPICTQDPSGCSLARVGFQRGRNA